MIKYMIHEEQITKDSHWRITHPKYEELKSALEKLNFKPDPGWAVYYNIQCFVGKEENGSAKFIVKNSSNFGIELTIFYTKERDEEYWEIATDEKYGEYATRSEDLETCLFSYFKEIIKQKEKRIKDLKTVSENLKQNSKIVDVEYFER